MAFALTGLFSTQTAHATETPNKSYFAWNKQGVLSFKLACEELETDGLISRKYWSPQFDPLLNRDNYSEIEQEQLSNALILALTHLRFGAVDQKTLQGKTASSLLELGLNSLRISRAIYDANIEQLFEQMRPDNIWYQRLKHRLRVMRAEALLNNNVKINPGSIIEPGDSDTRIAKLSKRLSVPVHSNQYSDELVIAVKQFQLDHGLESDGVLGPATIRALNQPPDYWIERMTLALERLRWLHDFPSDHFIFVDIAGFKVSYIRDGHSIWESNVQVGTPWRKSPVFNADMSYLVVNPEWSVPPGILKHDILPKLKLDHHYLDEQQMYAVTPDGEPVDTDNIDWSLFNLKQTPLMIKQRPGTDNALGRLKFMFPNQYNVYLHDTPHQEHFEEQIRTFSSGCIRLEKPLELATLLLKKQGWQRTKIQALIDSGVTKSIGLKTKIPVILFYATVNPLNTNKAQFYPDIYNRDTPLAQALLQEPLKEPLINAEFANNN